VSDGQKRGALGLRWLRPAAFDYGKKLAANNNINDTQSIQNG